MDSNSLNFYSFFTKYSLTDEYGFFSGLVSRVFRKFLPLVPDQNSVEYVLCYQKSEISTLMDQLDLEQIEESPIVGQLDLSIEALCSKIAAFGLDNNIMAKYKALNLNSMPFENLHERINEIIGANRKQTIAFKNTLEEVEALIIALRKGKKKIGTNPHLTLITRRVLEYTKRLKELLDLKLNLKSEQHWRQLFEEFKEYQKQKDNIRRYVNRHTDTLALTIVEHTAIKGEKYIAENRGEYLNFFYKALLGGAIIAVFALIKILTKAGGFTETSNALFFSLNYAACFIFVNYVGGVIATKQPAMTASKIAAYIDKKNNLEIKSMESIVLLIRRVFRTQFISIIGNFLLAFLMACLISYGLQLSGAIDLSKLVKSEELIKKVLPSGELFFFAAIAGVFLAISGLISGYVNNKVLVQKVAYRLSQQHRIFKGKSCVNFIEKKLGALVGNLCLGFLLGSLFLLSDFLPFDLDIRHIAFSTSNVGYAMMHGSFEWSTILIALLGALLVGLTNFLLSFSLTLYLALKSRGSGILLVPKVTFHVIKDFFKYPLHYFYSR